MNKNQIVAYNRISSGGRAMQNQLSDMKRQLAGLQDDELDNIVFAIETRLRGIELICTKRVTAKETP